MASPFSVDSFRHFSPVTQTSTMEDVVAETAKAIEHRMHAAASSVFAASASAAAAAPNPSHASWEKNEDSDEEFPETTPDQKIHFVFRDKMVPASVMTISCKTANIEGNVKSQNLKGLDLIQLVQTATNKARREALIAVEMERPKKIDAQGIVSIDQSKDWLLSLGGWKGMMAKGEVKKHFFSAQEPQGEETVRPKFEGAKILPTEMVFKIKGERICAPPLLVEAILKIPKNFKIDLPNSDFTYPQIIKIIEVYKQFLGLTESNIAHLQINILKNTGKESAIVNYRINKQGETEFISFLTFLNSLMFGMEASGINAALVTGVMTLELIRSNQITYREAFWANDSAGGVYPYANTTGNEGSYNLRSFLLKNAGKISDPDSFTMKMLRSHPNISLVTIKEAILIKKWVTFKQLISKDDSLEEAKGKISNAIESLITKIYLT